MKIILLVIISLLYYLYLVSRKEETFDNKNIVNSPNTNTKPNNILRNNSYFNENELFKFIINNHFTTDFYDKKHKLKKCSNENDNAYVMYLSNNCEENKRKAIEMLNSQFNLSFTEKEFNKLVKAAEEYYGSAKNELDLRKIKLVLNKLTDDTNSYKKILKDTSYVVPGIKKNFYPISVN